MTVEESQQALDERMVELAAYLDPWQPLDPATLALRLGVDTGAAQRLGLLSRAKGMEDIDVMLSAPLDPMGKVRPVAAARTAALAHPPLRELLEAWVMGAVKPSDDELDSGRYVPLLEYCLEALADASHRGNEEKTGRWAGRVLDLVETQLGRQRLESWMIGSNMLVRLARQLESEPRLNLADSDRQALLDRVRGMGSRLASPQQACAMGKMHNLGGSRDSLAVGYSDEERARVAQSILKFRSWEDGVLAALAIERESHRRQALADLELEVGSLLKPNQISGTPEGRLWPIYDVSRNSLDGILLHLEKP